MSPNKDETAVHGCHCRGDMAVRMRKVLQTAGLVFECDTYFFVFPFLDCREGSRAENAQRGETGAKRNKREETRGKPLASRLSPRHFRLFTLLFGYFARPLDYPERDC